MPMLPPAPARFSTIAERYAKVALEPVGGSSKEFAALLRADYDKYARLIKELNIRLN